MNKFRFHFVGLPHTVTAPSHSACAFTMKIYHLVDMLHSLGHEVFHYGAVGSEVSKWATDVPIITRQEQENRFGPYVPDALYNVDWKPSARYRRVLNERAVERINKRKQKGDFVCVIHGSNAQPIEAGVGNDVMTVEYGIGYNGTFAKYRVFESYAHMHKVWGVQGGFDPDGKFYDAVIPNYLNPDDYPFVPGCDKEDYFLYLGRLIKRKGIDIAAETCKRLGARLVVAGQGMKSFENGRLICEDGSVYDNVEYVGFAAGQKRADLYGKAKGVFVPTKYIEPFGAVAIEAQMAGTPAITTDFGAFTETVEHGRTGYRCHTLDHFVWAAKNVEYLEHNYIHERAVANWSMDRVRHRYQEYFEMLSNLWGRGWYAENPNRSDLDWLTVETPLKAGQ